jgi:hypothetical protein
MGLAAREPRPVGAPQDRGWHASIPLSHPRTTSPLKVTVLTEHKLALAWSRNGRWSRPRGRLAFYQKRNGRTAGSGKASGGGAPIAGGS